MDIVVVPRDRLEMRGVVDRVALDRAARSTPQLGDAPEITIDLSRAKFIDHDVLLLLGGLIAFRRTRSFGTRLELPDLPKVIDFLRAWEFPAFATRVADGEAVFTARSEQILAAAAERDPQYLSFVTGPQGRAPLLLRSNVAITPVQLTQDAWSAAAMATHRFLDTNFLGVMRRTLGRRAEADVPGIIHEAVLNAATHPFATLAFTSCQLRRRQPDDPAEKADGPRYEMQIAIWDDGASFSDTLLRTGETGQQIVSDRFGEEQVTFDLTVRGLPDGLERMQLTDNRPPPVDDPVLLSCAAFMLGVSSDPHGVRQARDSRSPRRQGGVGLFLLRTTAIDGFRGRVSYRSGDLRLTIKGTRVPARYDFGVDVRPDGGCVGRRPAVRRRRCQLRSIVSE